MKKKRKLKSWVKITLVVLVLSPVFLLFGKTYSRYYTSLINDSDVLLVPWNIKINNEKVTKAGEVEIIVNPTVTEQATTGTYKNKIVPGCKGYFDVEIDPTGTGVAIDYTIDFSPENLPGGMKFTKYEELSKTKEVVGEALPLPESNKLMGTMALVDGKLLNETNTLRYRIYWDYVDDDTLNTTAPYVDNQNSIMIKVILKQSI